MTGATDAAPPHPEPPHPQMPGPQMPGPQMPGPAVPHPSAPGAAPPDATLARVAALALPVVLSNATVPLQGAIDTAIIGNLGITAALAAIAAGTALVGLLFGAFNFLQMGTSGLTGQATGAGDAPRVVETLARALIVALALGLVLALASGAIAARVLDFVPATPEASELARLYLRIRLIGAPAELATYALIGWFIGRGRTRLLFEMQLLVSAVNVAATLTLAWGFGLGVAGAAIGTLVGVHAGLALGLWRAWRDLNRLMPAGLRIERARLADPVALGRMLRLSRDIFIRTCLLMGSLALIARLGGQQGDVVLAANGVLMQLVNVSAYALDGFAMAAETLVGQAIGARSRAALRRAVRVSTLAAWGLAALFALALTLAGPGLIRILTSVDEVRAVAGQHLLWVSLLPVVSVLAFQLDGIFIGAAEGARLRTAMIVAAGLFVPLAIWATAAFGNHGLWAAVWVFMGARAATLALAYPALEARAGP